MMAQLTPAQVFAKLYALTPEQMLEYLTGRVGVAVTFDLRDMWAEEHAQQFTVSRLARLDLLAALQEGITASVEGDLTRRDWMQDAEQLLTRAGWWGSVDVLDPATGDTVTTRFNGARLKLIFDTNTRVASSAGLWERVNDAKATHPYVRYITRGDEKVRASHAQWNGVTLPIDSAFWNTHWPPNGWRCRCRVQSMTRREYDARKADGSITTTEPPAKTRQWDNQRTGEVLDVPVGIDPGWDYNPGQAAARATNLRATAERKLAGAPAPIADAARKAGLWPKDEA